MPNYPYAQITNELAPSEREKINDNLVKIENDVKAVQGQVNSLAISPGDSSAEVLQARAGYEGTVYDTLSDRLNAEAIPQAKQDEWDAKIDPVLADASNDGLMSSEDYVTLQTLSTKPSWITPTLQNGWESRAGLAYAKRADGVIMFKGGFIGGTLGATVFTLPVGYRPGQTRYFVVPDAGANGTLYVMAIDSSGNVSVVRTLGTGTLCYIDGISFYDLAGV